MDRVGAFSLVLDGKRPTPTFARAGPRGFVRWDRRTHARRSGSVLLLAAAGAAPVLKELAQIGVLAARGLKVEDKVLDAEAQVVERFLELRDGLAHALVAV